MQSKNNFGITALYCRLSRDDGQESEKNTSMSLIRGISAKLKELGYKTGDYFNDALKYGQELRLKGIDKNEALNIITNYIDSHYKKN